MEKNQNKDSYFTSDLKLSAFLRLLSPESFIGLNRTNPNRINFVFKNTSEINDLVNGYLTGKKYLISPLDFATNIDQGKSLIYQNY